MPDLAQLQQICSPVFQATVGLRAALLFGSVARGQATPASDVDIAVVGAGIDLFGLGAELSRRLAREVDVVEAHDQAPIPLLRAILRDGVVLYERQPGEAATFRSRALTILDLDGPGYDRMMERFLARVAQRGVGA